MADTFLSALEWLPHAPADFKLRCAGLASSAGAGSELRALATHALDVLQLERLARTIDALRARATDLGPLTKIRVGVLGNGTQDFISAALVGSAPRHGLLLECVRAGYDQA